LPLFRTFVGMQNRQQVSFWVAVAFIVLLASCNSFTKLQKKGTDDQKYKAAVQYFKKGEWYKAGTLFEELIPVLKGSTESETAQFYYAYTQYHQQQYLLASSLFKKFYETFARSDFAQEASYMYALSLYKDTPAFNLDQSNTVVATSALQDFVNNYPQSPFSEDCTKMIKSLRQKLEQKGYEKAKLYYRASGFNILSLKSSVISINNFQKEFPDSDYNEELAYLKVDAQYNLAKNSLESKQKERYQDAVTFYGELKNKYPASKYLRTADKMYAFSKQELERLAALDKARELEKQQKINQPAKVTTGQ
jgi:outer membrane protein assembly factor BamD